MMFAVDPPLSPFHHGHQAFSTMKLKACPHGEPGTDMNSRPSLNVINMPAYADSGTAISPKGIECHISTASKSMDTGKPHLFSFSTSLTIQVFDDLDIRPREVPQAPVVTPQGCSIIVPHNVSSIFCDPSSHSVIPIPSHDHGESFTECRLQNHTDFAGLIYIPYSGTSLQHQIGLHSSDPEMMDQDPFFIASFLEACVLFDPGGDVATLPMCDIENVGVQTADDHLLVSRDSETTTDEEISHICPSLIHFVMTLEQQFITI
jgi:hypothetical protein